MPSSSSAPDPTHAERVELGAQLRAIREAAGLTQEQVALAIGLDRPSVVRIEHGQVDPHLSTLIRVASALGKQVALRDE